MAKSKLIKLLNDDEPLLDISSLIDVCFLLLIFFLVTSTILPTERDLPLQLPDRGKSIPQEDIVISVGLNEQGAVTLTSGGREETLDANITNRELPKLRDRLQLIKMAADPYDVVVLLDINENAEQQRFIDIINCLAGEEITKLSFVETQ